MENLPAEIISLIFEHLNLESKINLGLSSRVFLEEAKRKTQPISKDNIKIWMYKGNVERKICFQNFEGKKYISWVVWLDKTCSKYISKLDWFNCHREERSGPAYVKYWPNGNKMFEDWYQNGQLHRENGPAETDWYENGNIRSETWYKRGKKHGGKLVEGENEVGKSKTGEIIQSEKFGPTKTIWFENGAVASYVWYFENKLHREEEFGPAQISYFEDGTLQQEQWCQNGKLNRNENDGPASTQIYANGDKRLEWYKDDKLYRTNFPAIECYHKEK